MIKTNQNTTDLCNAILSVIRNANCIRRIDHASYDGKNFYAIREYENNRPTGIWHPFIFKDKLIPPKDLIQMIKSMEPDISEYKLDALLAQLEAVLYNSDIPEGDDRPGIYDHKLVPCANGVYDGRPGHEGFTPWDDIDQKYPGFCFYHKLAVNYNPNAECPAHFDPIGFIHSLFDESTETGRASARIAIQTAQFAIRGFSGTDGKLVWLYSDPDSPTTKCGKSTYIKLIKNLFHENDIYTGNLSGTFRPHGECSPKLLHKLAHISDEPLDTRANVSCVLNYIRRQCACHTNDKHMYIPDDSSDHVKIQATDTKPSFGQRDRIFSHQIVLYFEKDFSENSPLRDTKIKSKYVKDPAVLEYFLLQLCNMPFEDDYSYDQDGKYLLPNEQRALPKAMPAAQAIEDITGIFTARTIPLKVLYALYCGWCRKNHRKPKEADKFRYDVYTYCNYHKTEWEVLEERRYLTNTELKPFMKPDVCSVLVQYGGKDTWFAEKDGNGRLTGRFDERAMQRNWTGFLHKI